VNRQRFLAIWLGFSVLYLGLAVVGPMGLTRTGVWPLVNQHLLQVDAWRGHDIHVPSDDGSIASTVPVEPRLDVTPYFRDWVVADPREKVLLTNIACGVRQEDGARALEPVQYVSPDSVPGIRQLDRLECHVGSPLGPAFLMLPLRFVLGSALATQWLGALLGGLAVALMDLLLGWWMESVRGEGGVGGGVRFMLTVLAGFGTLWIWLAPLGEVWFFAQTVATCGLTLSLVLAWRRRWLTAGLAFALAFTSRPTVLLALPLLLMILHHQAGPGDRLGGLARVSKRKALAAASFFPMLVGGVHLLLNELRFGSPWDFGYRFMLTPPELREAWTTYGALHLHFLPTNLRFLFYQPPVRVIDEAGQWVFPFLVSDPHGMGLVFVTPAFLAALVGIGGTWRARQLVAACWVSLLLITLPALLYFNTGWVQWGGRYLLDAWPLWMMLAALGLSRIGRAAAILLVLLSILSNVWGAVLTALRYWP
jgi:hypothetical protein